MPFDLRSPVTEKALARLDARPEVIQFSSALTDSDYAVLGGWFAGQPAKTLRAYGSYNGTITDLDFLRHFPTLRSFQADALYHSLGNIDGLGYLPDDVDLIGLGRTKKKLSLAPLARFPNLRRVYLEGQSKDIEVISDLRHLRSITLRSITLPDLALLRPLTNLRALDLKLGGTKDLSLLPELPSLKSFELWMVKGISDLPPISQIPSLEYLFLQALRQVEVLPQMTELVALRRLWLETMKGVTTLPPSAKHHPFANSPSSAWATWHPRPWPRCSDIRRWSRCALVSAALERTKPSAASSTSPVKAIGASR